MNRQQRPSEERLFHETLAATGFGWLKRDHVVIVAAGNLKQRTFLTWRMHSTTLWSLLNPGSASQEGESCTVPLQPRYYANESVALLDAATAGLGIVCLPSGLCARRIETGQLRRVLPDWTAGKVTTTLLMPYRRGQLPSVRVVADLLIDQLAA